MGPNGIPLDEAELLSTLLEGLLYGFSLLMFAGTIWVLLFRRSSQQVNHKMLFVACALVVLSTTHLVIHIIRVVRGLIFYEPAYSSPNAYFDDVSQWTFVWKNHVYTAQSLVGDAVILYRCYSVWQSKLIMVLPVLLWCGTGVTGFLSSYTASKVTQNEVFGGVLSQWITSFWALALSTNLLTTILLASRIWYVDQRSKKIRVHRKSQLRPIFHIIIDAGMIYSFTLLAALICFVSKSNGQYVTLDMVTPIISITFYMVIIRVGLATNGPGQATNAFPLAQSTSENSWNADRRSRMEVHVTTLTESKVENGLRSAINSMTPMARDNRRNEIKLDGMTIAV